MSNGVLTSTAEPPARLKRVFLLALLLALGTTFLYAPAVRNGFVNYDDPDYVTRNTNVLQGISRRNVVWAFGTENPAANWHPLTWLSHMLDVQWYGQNPAGHHLTNVFLFALDIALLFLFLEAATHALWRSAAVAALFGVHPLNVESVAWVAERKAVLCLAFFFLALLCYVWYSRKPGVLRYLCLMFLFAMALMSKIMVITLPFCLLLLDYWPLGRLAQEGESSLSLNKLGAMIVEKVPLFLLSVAGACLTLYMHHKEGALTGVVPLAWRVKNSVYSYLAYLGKIAWPANLAVFYPHPENSLAWWKVAVAGTLLLAITAIVWHFRQKQYLQVGWLWYVGVLFPMIGFVQSGRQGMADRYACLSLLGVLLALVWLSGDLVNDLKLNPGIRIGLFAAALIPCVYLTRVQIGYWRDSYTLFTHALQVTKDNGIAENNLGNALMQMHQADAAEPHFLAAVRLIPDLASAHYNLGIVLQEHNQTMEAAREYGLALRFSADHNEMARAHNNLGVIFLQTKDFVAAGKEFGAAIALNPNEVNSYIGRGISERQTWQFPEAVADFTRAAALAPSASNYFLLGNSLEDVRDYAQAEKAYEAVLQLAPNAADARSRLESVRSKAAGATSSPKSGTQ
jgi:tetratricopeptide (TPR) repeat protein